MNNLTNNQQTIINQIIGEFNRMNTANNSNKKFNLIDINPLEKINREIKEFEELANADSKAWEKIANNEAQRIVDLLKEDLKGYSVQKYGKENGFIDIPVILIRKSDKHSTHNEDSVRIQVHIQKEDKLVHGSFKQFGIGLKYSSTYNGLRYNTIEEALNDEWFQLNLRRIVLK
jgi:hypothetical protein